MLVLTKNSLTEIFYHFLSSQTNTRLQGRTQRGAAGAVATPKKIKLAIFILL